MSWRADRAAVLLPFALAFLGACTSFTFDASQPIADVTGAPPSLSGRQRIALSSGEALKSFMRGGDGVQYAVFATTANHPSRNAGQLALASVRAVRLGEPEDATEFMDGTIQIGQSAIYVTQTEVGANQTVVSHVQMYRPGEVTPQAFEYDRLIGSITSSDDGAVLFIAPELPPGALMQPGLLVRTDGSFRIEILVGPSIHFGFNRSGSLLFSFDDDGMVRSHSTSEQVDATLGPWSPYIVFFGSDDVAGELFVCDGDSLRALPFQPEPPRVFDPAACSDWLKPVSVRGHWVYGSGLDIHTTVRDGSAPPNTLWSYSPDVTSILALDAAHVAVGFTPMQPPQFSPKDVSDGWVDGRQFMERGRRAGFSADGQRIYFVEHAADSRGVGELRVYDLGSDSTRTLALNAFPFAELADGRLIAATNLSEVGDFNRVVVIDVDRGTVDWVAAGADDFTLVPGTNEALVTLSTGDDAKTLVRVPIPPRR